MLQTHVFADPKLGELAALARSLDARMEELPPGGDGTPPPAGGESQGGDQGDDDKTDWKAMARKHEARAKENADAAKELATLKQSQMTEQQKLEERATKAESERTALQTENARYKVALAKGLPADLAGRLQGSTDDELAADADKLLALMGGKTPANPSAGAPNLQQGARGAADKPLDGNDWLRGFARGK